MLPDKDGDRCDDDEHSSESASHQIVLSKNDSSDRGQDEQGENHFSLAPSNPSKGGLTIGAFTVQCGKCFKWRLIPTQEKYEEIRERIQREPFVCERAREWKPDVTCDDPTDLSQDDSRIWAIDKPSIAQAPRGWERLVIIRKEGSTRFADVYYISPSGKKLRSTVDVEKYLAENPEHAVGVEMTQFSFKIPAPLQPDYVKKRPPQLRPSDGAHTGSTKPPQLEYVLPLAWAAAAHEDLADYRLVPYNEDPPKLLQGEPPLEKNKGSPKSGVV